MSDSKQRNLMTRRAVMQAGGLFSLSALTAHAQGFAGLGRDADGFAAVVPGLTLTFPADYGAHPDFRIEWWYLTANLTDETGDACGLQWTLFRQAMQPGPQRDGWASQQIWMGHAAVTTASVHRVRETFARGGVELAGADASPFHAWIDDFEMQSTAASSADTLSAIDVHASAPDFSYRLQLATARPVVLQGDAGYSKKSDRGLASYYFSQPFFEAQGEIVLDGKSRRVSGHAWMDREWSSQPLASDQTGWDWLSLHLESTDKLMLFRLRQKDHQNYFAGNWIGADGRSELLAPDAIKMSPLDVINVQGRSVPVRWRVEVAGRDLAIDTVPLNTESWMDTTFPYWEGPISFTGSHAGVGYLEMTGY
jgi:predicted secreted hydrolase